MSRSPLPGSTSTAPGGGPVAGRQGPGRHRLGRPAGVRCSDLPAVRERMQASDRQSQPRSGFLRWLFTGAPSGRHTWSSLVNAGGRPRTAFAIILSL